MVTSVPLATCGDTTLRAMVRAGDVRRELTLHLVRYGLLHLAHGTA